ncbi:MAG TPA: hypothetical protein VMW73_09585, partial [Spirochaetia bacterium]|nr:hypothetical protein [Spirochaetia bacterium]
MEQEKIITEYNPVLMRRLFGYLKPYRSIALFAALALIVATASELLIPVVLQRAIDRNLTNSYSRIRVDAASLPELHSAKIDSSDVRIGAYYYIPNYRLKMILGVSKA